MSSDQVSESFEVKYSTSLQTRMRVAIILALVGIFLSSAFFLKAAMITHQIHSLKASSFTPKVPDYLGTLGGIGEWRKNIAANHLAYERNTTIGHAAFALLAGLFFLGMWQLVRVQKIRFIKTNHVPQRFIAGYRDTRPENWSNAFILMLLLSLLIAWIPILGSIAAGFVGATKAKTPGAAMVAANVTGLCFFVASFLFSLLPGIGWLLFIGAMFVSIIHFFLLMIGVWIGGHSIKPQTSN